MCIVPQWKRRGLGGVPVALTVWMLVCTPRTGAAASCESVGSRAFPNATITSAVPVPMGGFTPPATGRGATPAPYTDLPAFCRVTATLTPADRSDIKIEVWMPAAGWNGKFNAVGNGGWAGSIAYGGLRDAVRRGYAASSTDTGHVGGNGSFAQDPVKYVDFGYRAVHEMTVTAKALINAFYDQGPRLSYWDGCSNGGRQGLADILRYPADFDGVVAGAPSNFFSRMNAGMLWIAQAVHQDDASGIPAAKYALIHAGVLAACDANDVVKDGVVEDPTRCTFDPKVLECKGDDAATCLTPAQVATVRKIYAPAINPRTKQTIYPGLAPGSELGWALLAGPQPLANPTEFFKYIVFKDPNWDYRTLNFDSDVARAQKADNGTVDATDPNLEPFFARGGRLIQYHGWSDQALAPQQSINYYRAVAEKLGVDRPVHAAYRLFMVPGMGHCSGGDGAASFDMLGALDRWREGGTAPDRIVASRVRNGTVDRTRALCPYPQVAAYTGGGSTDDAANFVCKAP